MARYDKEFKLICINALKNKQPLPEVKGVLPTSLVRYAKLWRLIYRQMGEKGLEDGFILFIQKIRFAKQCLANRNIIL